MKRKNTVQNGVFLGMMLLTLTSLVAAQGSKVFVIEATYFPGNQTFSASDIDITTGTPTFYDGGPMRVQLLNASGDVLYTASFTIYPPGAEKTLDPGESLAPSHDQYRLPYHANATTLRFTRNNTVLTTIDLTGQMCAVDGFCRPYCQGKAADPDCPDYVPPEDTEGDADGDGLPWGIIGLLTVLVVVAIGYWRYGHR